MTFRERLAQLWDLIFGPKKTEHPTPPPEPMAGPPRSDQIDIVPEERPSDDPPLP